MFEERHALGTYLRASKRFANRAALKSAQDRALAGWLRDVVPKVPRYAGFSGGLCDLPVIGKADVMADFAAFNRAGIDAVAAWAALERDCRVGRFIVGASTGTSGNRGFFVISEAERFRWLGMLLAKALPGFWRQRQKVAVMLPRGTPLYSSANRMPRFQLRFFDLGGDFGAWAEELVGFDPTVIVAPPKVLRWLAEAGVGVRPRRVFSGAEVLDPVDRAVIEGAFGGPMGEIYMATEGLMGVTCPLGTLHLAEDFLHFELPVMGDDPALRAVIFSDFSRETQVMARYAMNDLVRLGQCACGSPLQAVAEVVGRRDDCFEVEGALITPDVLRNAVVDADASIGDFRVVQVAPGVVEVWLAERTAPEVLEAARARVAGVFEAKGVGAEVSGHLGTLEVSGVRKLRRVENRCAF